MEFEIVIKDEEYDKIKTIMHNINTLNKGFELGAWFLGKWTITENKAQAYLYKLVIPEQEVSKCEVDISPESMIDTIKEVGIEESNNIKAHWHIHPFGTGKTNWSSTDEDKINDFMEPTKKRDIFIFLLSSEDKIKGRVVMNNTYTNKFLNITSTSLDSVDDLEVIKESELQINPYLEEIKNIIEKKVTQPKPITSKNNFNKWGFKSKPNKHIDRIVGYNTDYYKIQNKGSRLVIKFDKYFYDYLKKNDIVSKEIINPDKLNIQNNSYIAIWNLENKREVKLISSMYENELEEAYLEFVGLTKLNNEITDLNNEIYLNNQLPNYYQYGY